MLQDIEAMPRITSVNKFVHFGPHNVTNQIFHTTSLSFCLVNLKPLLPGHVLVSPFRQVQHLTDLNSHEISDLFLTVQQVSRTLKRVYNATALNVAVQDGEAAGQSVPHVHAHVIPRREGDMDSRGGGDKIYELLEGSDGDVGAHQSEQENGHWRTGSGSWPTPDQERQPRSAEDMRQEAEWLASEMEKDEKGSQPDV